MVLPDFDTLKNLAAADPQAFEALRLQHIEALITSAPESMQQRLRGLQFQIDGQRRLSSNPMGACVRISRMMHDSFGRLREALNEAAGGEAGLPDFSVPEAATVLPFRARG